MTLLSHRGRKLTPQGQRDLDRIAGQVSGDFSHHPGASGAWILTVSSSGGYSQGSRGAGESLGYFKTLFSNSGKSTSSEVPEDIQKEMGMSEGLIRFSMGLDNDIEATFQLIKESVDEYKAGK